ncbi:SHOCT domain-containing protein [Peterkaempfera sp. SMS 1(5)a]|uniref:SHOCT domain-containing protein n=1 Tax=Peterkaempfera podocarpi TaxID=3232308 RepID=UPI00366A63C7
MIGRRVTRSGRPGLIGTVARTAVVAGTATAVSGRVAERQQQRAAQEAAAAQQPQQAAAQPPQPAASAAAGPGTPDSGMLHQLERLAELHTQGMLTAEEFAAAKQRLLGV